MQLKILKEDKNRLEVEVIGESETITQLIARNAQEFGDAAAVREHPFMANPKLIISGANPRKILEKAISETKNQIDEFSRYINQQV